MDKASRREFLQLILSTSTFTTIFMTLIHRIKNSPNAIIKPLILFLRRIEEFLGPEDDWVEDSRRIFSEAAQRHLGHIHSFTTERSTAEYVMTVKESPDVVEKALMPPYSRNIISNRKYRTYHGGGKQWATGSFVIDPEDTRWQHHVYIFRSKKGYTDVHAHRETSVRYGRKHLTEKQYDGDPHTLFDIFNKENMTYTIKDYDNET